MRRLGSPPYHPPEVPNVPPCGVYGARRGGWEPYSLARVKDTKIVGPGVAYRQDERPLGRVTFYRRLGARWCLIPDRSPAEPVPVSEAHALREGADLAVWTPEARRGSPVLSASSPAVLEAWGRREGFGTGERPISL